MKIYTNSIVMTIAIGLIANEQYNLKPELTPSAVLLLELSLSAVFLYQSSTD